MTILGIQEKVREIQKDLTEHMDNLMKGALTIEIADLNDERYEKLRIELEEISKAYGTLMGHFQILLSIK